MKSNDRVSLYKAHPLLVIKKERWARSQPPRQQITLSLGSSARYSQQECHNCLSI